jgi:t-SNARE complex subunit (syntaxin)
MTNEEITEEIYFEAHTKGFIKELRAKVDEFKVSIHYHKLPHNEMVYKAYNIVKPEETNDDLHIFI